jgi:hypothetical protein
LTITEVKAKEEVPLAEAYIIPPRLLVATGLVTVMSFKVIVTLVPPNAYIRPPLEYAVVGLTVLEVYKVKLVEPEVVKQKAPPLPVEAVVV